MAKRKSNKDNDQQPEQTAAQQAMQMAAGTLGRDLLAALVMEVKLLPDVWAKLPKVKQDDVIERLRNRVDSCVRMAVHLIASEGRATIAAEVDSVTIKDGIKAVLTLAKSDPNRHELMDAQGTSVLIVVSNPADHLNGIGSVQGEADQRAMDLGTEYAPNSDGAGMDGEDDDVVDAEWREPLALPEVADSDLEAAYQMGRRAAEEGLPKSDCPQMRHELVAQWQKGWADWHEEHQADATDTVEG